MKIAKVTAYNVVVALGASYLHTGSVETGLYFRLGWYGMIMLCWLVLSVIKYRDQQLPTER